MPVDMTLADGYLFIKMHGTVTAQDFIQYAQDAEALELQQSESLHRITDMVDVKHFELHYKDVFQLAERRKRQRYTRPVKSAIIVCAPVQMGMSRMFQTVADSEFVQIQVVKSLAEALEWIGIAPPTVTEK